MFHRRVVLKAAVAAALLSQADHASAEPLADWRRISSEGAPGGRWDHTLSAHGKRKELLLAFGRDGEGTPLGDCWVTDRSNGEWEPLGATGPAPRFGHAVATDDATGLIYLFGGQQADQFFNELWVLDLDANQWQLLSNDVGPSPRYGTSLVHDGSGALYVSHGFTFEGRFDDTWRFDLATAQWEDRSPAPEQRPLRRCLHEAVWNDASGSMWLYGGCSSGFGPCPQGDCWQFNPDAGTWHEVTVNGPSSRSNPSLVVDHNRDRLLLFGGLTSDGPVDDFWIGTPDGDAISWEAVASPDVGPGPRSSHDAVMSGGAFYLFGGLGPEGAVGDLWRGRITP